MTDNYTDDTYSEDVEPVQESPKQLREAANRGSKYRAERDALARENAFLKAGINADDQRLAYFVKGYDGELDPQAIQKAAIEAGFLQAPQQGQRQELQQTANAQRRVAAASAGALQEGATENGALAQLEAAMAQGGVPAMLEVARQYGLPVVQ